MIKADIQFVRSLADKRVRDAERLFVAEGAKLVEEIVASTMQVRRIYTTRDDVEGQSVERIERRDMERISQLKTPTDTLAVVCQPRHELNLDRVFGGLVLALDGVQNPGNMGTILRLADWFGVEDVVCSAECADCYNSKVVQATMGAILRVRVHYVESLPQFLDEALRRDVPVYGTLLDGKNIYNERLSERGVVVMGNEGRGVSDACRSRLTHALLIPPYPQDAPTSESLNVAMATGIVLAEFRRRM